MMHPQIKPDAVIELLVHHFFMGDSAIALNNHKQRSQTNPCSQNFPDHIDIGRELQPAFYTHDIAKRNNDDPITE